MMQQAFQRFVGIDWSGAEGEFHTGIQLVQLSLNTKCPQVVMPPKVAAWSRHAVLHYIKSLADQRTLVGLDFGFSLPWHKQDYLPPYFEKLHSVRELWAYVDDFCKESKFLHAAPIWRSNHSPLQPFIKYWSHKFRHEGVLFNGGFLRETEKKAKANGLQPKSIYRMVGPQVGAGSFSGMRVLHALGSFPKDIAIWPFDDIEGAKIVVVEIYPAIFYRRAGHVRPSKRQVKSGAHLKTIRDTLSFFGVECGASVSHSIDEMDAMISAAALCSLSKHAATFRVPNKASLKEGWIFGVPVDEDQG